MSMYTSSVEGSIWEKSIQKLSPSEIKNVDTIPMLSLTALKYIVSAYNKLQNKTKILEMNIVNDEGQIKDQVFGKIGSTKISINAIQNSGNLELRVQNNEIFEIVLEIARLKFS